ncbi:Pex19 protein [Lasiodiplodia theobromae]|uniref:Peroxisome biogenesis protein 19-1 n=1 Tax=Lasiodiplodia theobromae TaxID=45133 RepID=A0A5N5DDN1_9PEZI|nr:Pex19 protein [Lasiodiplodia theobromae]KAB2575164.1 Peroxisome biogenesis protein 19-1 [Lasiodiplodia theobromae]KAF4538946.1 Pex19 protein [Lasiodiplodia theobromae]KAF9637366.1 Pex19 protein [Lasiodiplodia theobromae]
MADQKEAAKQSGATESVPTQPPAQQRVEDIPDPDEDDLDDLDDVLDEFSATKLDDSAADKQVPATHDAQTAPAATANPLAPGAAGEDEIDEEEFARQLQAGMAELLGGLGDSPEMTQQLESLVKELGSGAASSTTSTPAASGSGSGAKATPGATAGNKAGEDKFQEQIRRTMERMQASGEQASAAAASSSGNPDDILAQMLAEMEKGDFGGDFGSDEDFSKMLMGMMEQLTNKEILYEPMKELHDKFPDWMAKNRDKTDKADLERYEEQQRCVKDIVERFERPGYTDDSTADREYIVERMQKMQAAGSPPQDLVGDMSSAQEALGELDQGCATQ